MIKTRTLFKGLGLAALTLGAVFACQSVQASSHREAPLIAQDPQADNTDLYVFRSPDDTNTVTIIANYIPFQLPEGGPNFYTFGQNIRYEIHIKNNTATTKDDITYRFTFSVSNQDPNTFFNIRLGKQNQRTSWSLTKLVGGSSFGSVIATGFCPPPNVGRNSIEGQAGLSLTNYDTLVKQAIVTASGAAAKGERIFCGSADDPYFADIAGIFDLGGFRPKGNSVNTPKDGYARYNVSTIAMKIPISTLQKAGQSVTAARNILDPDYVIGVWASASRKAITTFAGNGTLSYPPDSVNSWVQVSRVGMPLTNEIMIPIGKKDLWNSVRPENDDQFDQYFKNPEVALYLSDKNYGNQFPALNELRIQLASRSDLIPGGFDFHNGAKGLWPIKGINLAGTALDPLGFGNMLIPDSTSPRSVDILPLFYTGFPNLAPYQLATGKNGDNPLATGKPFINNFLPTYGDMIRLNMAVPVTPRNGPSFSSLGILKAAEIGLNQSPYNLSNELQWIPNMDGFPNGRRLEDDVVTIEMQMMGGAGLAILGYWYDDYHPGGATMTTGMQRTFDFSAGPDKNDTTFKANFPYVQVPWSGADYQSKPRF